MKASLFAIPSRTLSFTGNIFIGAHPHERFIVSRLLKNDSSYTTTQSLYFSNPVSGNTSLYGDAMTVTINFPSESVLYGTNQ